MKKHSNNLYRLLYKNIFKVYKLSSKPVITKRSFKNKKLKQDEIIKLVQEERKVMSNTIIRALKDKKIFKMNSDNSYSIV